MYHFDRLDRAAPAIAPTRQSHLGRILVVEDEASPRSGMVTHFVDRGWSAIGCAPRDLTRHLHCRELSLVTLNAKQRSTSGLDVLRQIRTQSHIPVIMYDDGHDDEINRIIALELGADDFLRGPLNLRECLARARAILRRQELGRVVVQPLRGGYRFDGWELRHAKRELRSPEGSLIALTRKEYALLGVFLSAPRRLLSRIQLMRATRADEDIFDRSIDVQVLRLRRKLQAGPSSTQLIKTERGFGYMLDAAVEPLF